MKKVLNINLSGKSYAIDDDAFYILDKYLNDIEKHFSHSSGFEDIMYDIEERISELFDENRMNSDIITKYKVEAMQEIMGHPEAFGSEETVEHAASGTGTAIPTERKFFRDPDDKWLAGVVSGLAAYLGLERLLLMRLVFLVLVMSGIGIIPYLFLWVVIPKASSASDRLAMHGERINVESIGNAVEQGLTEVKDSIEDLSKNLKSKLS